MGHHTLVRPLVRRAGRRASEVHVAIYRRSEGRRAGAAKGVPLLLLTTTGRVSGRTWTRPVGYMRDGQRLVVCGSNGGRGPVPGWAHNLRAHPQAHAQVGPTSVPVTAHELHGEQYDHAWTQLTGRHPVYATYLTRTDRDLPLFALEPAAAATSGALAAASAARGADVHEMVVIHRIFRRHLAEAATIVRTLDDDTPAARRTDVAAHVEFLLTGLHNHHVTEDEFLWPRLQSRASPHVELVARMETQHATAADRISTAEASLARWRAEPSQVAAAELATAIDELLETLNEHLDDEEREILPLVAEHLTVEEWERLGQQSMEKFPRSAMPLMLGQMIDVATPEEAEQFLAKLPLPPRIHWRLIGHRQYQRRMDRVRNGAA